MNALATFLTELTRRKVWLFGGIYLALGWVVLQVVIAVEATMELPNWIDQSVLVLLVLGFPVALLLAWAQETQGQGLQEGAVGAKTGDAGEARPGFSVAVLPFDDLSRDGGFSDIADGVPEDVLTRLPPYSLLNVAARNSSFAFKGTSPDIRKVGEALQVRFVLEGSVRKVGEKLRITAQLIETLPGDHAWSNSFDCPLETLDTDLDEIVDRIVVEVFSTTVNLERERLEAQQPDDLLSTDLVLLAQVLFGNASLANYEKAEVLANKALEKAPGDAKAHATMAYIQAALPIYGSGKRAAHQEKATAHLEQAKSSGTTDVVTLMNMIDAAVCMSKWVEADVFVERMRRVAPDNPNTWDYVASSHLRAGKYSEALAGWARVEVRSSVHSPWYANRLPREAMAHMGLGDFAAAEALLQQNLAAGDNEIARRLLVTALAHQGKLDEAAAELEEMKKFWPRGLTLVAAERLLRSLYPQDDIIALQLEGLRLAGLEDGGKAHDA